jgi:hypothetical protein
VPYVKQPAPEGLDPSLRRRWSALQDRMVKNSALEEELARYGATLQLVSVVAYRLQAFIDAVFPADGTVEQQSKRLEIDEQVQEKAAEFLTGARSQVVQAMLASGTQVPKPLLDKMAAQQGLGPNGTQGLYRGKP